MRDDVPRQKFHYDWHWQWDYGNGDLGNQGIHQMDVARWGLNEPKLAESVVTFGGRLGYEDDGQTPNTEMSILQYGDRLLIFETRGLVTKRFQGEEVGQHVGNVFHCENGYLACDYESAAVFDKEGKQVKQFSGGADHFENFIQAVRSRKPADLNGEIEEGHVSSALCHLANISYRLGAPQAFGEAPEALAGNEFATDLFSRTKTHLEENGVKLAEAQYTLGSKLAFDPGVERFVNNSAADALLTREYRKGYEVSAQA